MSRAYTLEAVELPFPPDTLIEVGMLVDVEGHGLDLTISGISVTVQPTRDPAAEGSEVVVEDFDEDRPGAVASTVGEVPAIEAALLPYAVFGLSREGRSAGWCYGRQIKAIQRRVDVAQGRGAGE